MKTKFTTVILLCILISAFTATVSKAQYVDDFEGANNGWTISSLGGSYWQYGTPNWGATNSAHSGTHAWDIELDSAYLNSSHSFLNSPVFNFSAVTNATLSFWRNTNCEQNWDGTRMEYSTDGGSTWSVLGAVGIGTNWYNVPSLLSSSLPAWTGNSGGWVQSSISLSMLDSVSSPVQFRFVFTSDASVMYDGISIDDFSIDQVPAPAPGPPFSFNANAQQNSNPCNTPYNTTILMYGVATNFVTGDTLSINVNFGDGTDTTYITSVTNGFFFTNASHFYGTAGQFSLQYIINGPGGFADTLTQYNQLIFGGCGSIEGQLYLDDNGNCVFDSLEIPLTNFPVQLFQTGTFHSWAYTDSTGKYYFIVPNGFNYTVSLDTANAPAGMSFTCPASASYNVSAVPALGLNFATTCSNSFDLSVHASSWGLVPGFNSYLHIWLENNACQPVSGTAILILPPGVSYLYGINGATVSNDTVQWTFTNLITSFFGNDYYNATIHIDSNLTIGDTLCFEIFVTPLAGDIDSSNNYFRYCRVITGSYDPNEKLVEPAGITSAGLVHPNTTFTYTVGFQNTGTAPAHNVSILDTLDADLDPATLQILNSTHQMSVDYLPGNILRFNFFNIMLPDSNSNEPLSHGALQYSITARPGLLQGTQIENTAHIFFDFNPDVVTNTTLNTIDYTLSVTENNYSNSFVIYPQPAGNFFSLRSDKTINGLLKIFDAKGKQCKQLLVNNNTVISTADLTGGVYYITLQTSAATLTNKLVIIK